MLSHLVYVSTRKKNCTDKEIAQILETCRKNNLARDITGVLLYSETQFVQYLEGEYQEIVTLYDHIKKDDRHQNAVMVSSCAIAERSFPSWQMGTKEFHKIAFHAEMSQDDKRVFETVLAGQEQQSSKTIALIKKLFK